MIVTCQKLCRKFSEQKMEDLPTVRGYEAAPFTHYRADMFMLFNNMRKRSDHEWYCALFTGFTSQAVHIEVTSAMDSDSFMQILQRFTGKGGPNVIKIWQWN